VAVRDFHENFAWFVVVGNGLAGAWALGANWLPQMRTRALWWFTVFVEVGPGQVLSGLVRRCDRSVTTVS